MICCLANNANAQIRADQNMVLYGTPVTVFNNTEEKKPVVVFVNGQKAGIVEYGLQTTIRLGAGLWVFQPDVQDVAIAAQVCESVRLEQANLNPPGWAKSSLFGENALTEQFLFSTFDERKIADRVKKIKKHLDETKHIGRDKMKAELDAWLKLVKKVGARGLAVCVNPGPVTDAYYIRVWADNFSYRTSYVLRVVGNKEDGYWLSDRAR
jgi:hypothetical protein